MPDDTAYVLDAGPIKPLWWVVTKFEYHILILQHDKPLTALLEELNQHGQMGWEALALESDAWGRMFVLKRPVREEEGR